MLNTHDDDPRDHGDHHTAPEPMAEPMAEPTTEAEFVARYTSNTRLTGVGAETTMHEPCPFCAAPDCRLYRIVDVATQAPDEATCRVCGRTARYLRNSLHDATGWPYGVQIEMVQTGGPDAPAWMTHKPRYLRRPETGHETGQEG